MSVLAVKTKIQDMSIGDIIPCRYKASSGTAGIFSELGICTAAEIPKTGTSTPDGKFNFIKVDKGLLIADRVVQTGISWDTLNTKGYIEGRSFYTDEKLLLIPGLENNQDVTYGALSYPEFVPRMFDGNSNTGWTWGGTWTIFLGLPKLKRISRFVIKGSNLIINFYGSNTSLKVGHSSIPIIYTGVDYNINSNYQYKYYSWTLGSNGSDSNPALQEITIYGGDFIGMIRSLSGGNAYLGTDGKASLTDKLLGAWPTNNEWDKYIVSSDLGGKITPGDNNVWHWNGVYSWVQDTLINHPANRTLRGEIYINSGRFSYSFFFL